MTPLHQGASTAPLGIGNPKAVTAILERVHGFVKTGVLPLEAHMNMLLARYQGVQHTPLHCAVNHMNKPSARAIVRHVDTLPEDAQRRVYTATDSTRRWCCAT